MTRISQLTNEQHGIFGRKDDSALIRIFQELHVSIILRLSDQNNWRGGLLRDLVNGFQYQRLIYNYCACVKSVQTYTIGVNIFEKQSIPTEWHNHRFPFLIYPISLNGELGRPVYKMEWQDKKFGKTGHKTVFSGELYAIHRCVDIYHKVTSICAHASINVSDVTSGASRPSRMIAQSLESNQISDSLEMVRSAAENQIAVDKLEKSVGLK